MSNSAQGILAVELFKQWILAEAALTQRQLDIEMSGERQQ